MPVKSANGDLIFSQVNRPSEFTNCRSSISLMPKNDERLFVSSNQSMYNIFSVTKIRAAAGSTARLPCHAYTIITADLDNNDSAITDVQCQFLEIYFCNKLSRFDENACGYGYCELEINSIDNQPLVKCICEYGYSGLFCESKDDEYSKFEILFPSILVMLITVVLFAKLSELHKYQYSL
ncbi:hypothetical protein T01_771, partial [Trichinella spiralis]